MKNTNPVTVHPRNGRRSTSPITRCIFRILITIWYCLGTHASSVLLFREERVQFQGPQRYTRFHRPGLARPARWKRVPGRVPRYRLVTQTIKVSLASNED